MELSSSSEYSPMLPTKALATKDKSTRPLPVAVGWLAFISATLALISLTVKVASPPFISLPATSQFPLLSGGSRDLLSLCSEHFITQELDHFRARGNSSEGSFHQRYFVCLSETFNPKNGSIFFYVGNEADVTLYLNHTGLMWENAATFNALLVFAEHRYFGKSIPFGLNVLDHMEYLSTQQALADYAVLIEKLRHELAVEVPVIGFGGSYGGMLGTWFRMKYPHIIDGMIAGSAPVLSFLGDSEHPIDTEGFNRIVTFDMSKDAGAAPNCISNLRQALKVAIEMSNTTYGRHKVAKLLNLCDENYLASSKDIIDLASNAYSYLAMGNYPYPTSYIMNGLVELPGYPMRAACEPFADTFSVNDTNGLLQAFRDSIGVYYNATKNETCLLSPRHAVLVNKSNASEEAKAVQNDTKGNFWGYLECSELYMPMSTDGVHDVFPASPVNQSQDDKTCFEQWGVHLKPQWAHIEFGGVKALREASNIVFSNGNFDPWSALGVLESLSSSVVAVPIAEGAHHLDLFFTHPLDPPAVTEARQTELAYVRQWVDEFYANKRKNVRVEIE